MTITSKKKKKPSSLAKSRKEIVPKLSKEQLKKRVVKEAKVRGTYDEIRESIRKQTGSTISRPTVKKYLVEAWGDNFKKNRAKMSKRRTLARKWRQDFESDRAKVKQIFWKDYLSAGDGLLYRSKDNKLIPMPAKVPLKPGLSKLKVLDEEYYKRPVNWNKITFSKDGNFGYSDDKGERGIFDASISQILMKQLRIKLKNDPDKERKLKDLSKQIDEMKTDLRSDMLFGSKILDRNMCPGWATSDKTTRGRTRMLAMEGIDPETGKPYVFSRAVMNIPHLLHTPQKRIQVQSHNIIKEPATLLNSEDPKVLTRFNDVEGINLRVRMPKDWVEDKMTEESAVIISKDAANRMRYFSVVEEGSLMVDDVDKLPDTVRVDKKVRTYEDAKDHLVRAIEVHRGDLVVMGAIKDIEGSIAETQVSHSGKIILVGEPKERIRNITVDPDLDPRGRSTRKIIFFRQDYQIIREDELHRGDKVLIRGGIKSVVGDIRDDLGKDKKGRKYDMIVNYTDVWRKADPSDPDFALKEETFIRQGKKKASAVLEHRDANGEMFTFIIDKFSQDQGSQQAMRMSTTFTAGLWEMCLAKVLDKQKYTNAELRQATRSFVERYIREPSTMLTSLPALHYRLVERDDKIIIERDPHEPQSDKYGKIYQLVHEDNGKMYYTVYMPNFIARLYRDVRTARERFKIDLADVKPEDKAYQWAEIIKTVKNSMYLFPKIMDSKDLVAIAYVNPKDVTDTNTIIMDSLDVEAAGGDPSDPDLKLSWRKEPVSSKASIQTARVLTDFSGKYRGVVGVHVESAKKAVLDFDGDQIIVFSPAIQPAMIKLSNKEKENLEALRKKDYSQETFEKLYEDAAKTKYAESEKELGIKCAEYNQTIANLENRLIRQLGGIRRGALILYKSERPPIFTIGEGKSSRKFELTPMLVNRVCDVEKILKMREPYWKLQELYDRKWKTLTESERDLVEDMHIRREIGRMTKLEQKDPNVLLMLNLLRKEHTVFTEEGTRRERKIDPLGLVIDPKSNRLLDQILYQQIKASKMEVHKEEKK